MKLFEVTDTTWENLQIATHKSVQCAKWMILICALQFADFLRLCHLEQPHAQCPFLFPIIFGINLISFFDIGSVLSVLRVCAPYLGQCVAATATAFGFGSWSFVFHSGLPCQIYPSSPNPLSNIGLGVLNDGGMPKIVFFLQSNAVRE